MEHPSHRNHHNNRQSDSDSSSEGYEEEDEVSEDEVIVYHNNSNLINSNPHDVIENQEQHRSQVNLDTSSHLMHNSSPSQHQQHFNHDFLALSRSESLDESEKRTFVRSSATPSTNSSNRSFQSYNPSQQTSKVKSNSDSSMPCPPVILSVVAGNGPLGIQIIPFCDPSKGGHHNGMVIESIQSGSRIDRDGRFNVDDWIIEVNGRSLLGCSFETAQQRFREELLRFPEVNLKVIKKRVSSSSNATSSAATTTSNGNNNIIMNQSKSSQVMSPLPVTSSSKTNKKSGSTVSEDECDDDASKSAVTCSASSARSSGKNNNKSSTTISSSLSSNFQSLALHHNVVEPSRARSSSPSSSSTAIPVPLLAAWNTSKIGKKYHIRLQKQESGLGFTITTRDNPAGGNAAGVYVKTILPRGPAIIDGRLKQGDRLLEVNGVLMTGKTQEEAVDFIKSIPVSSQVDLIVSRQELLSKMLGDDVMTSSPLPCPTQPRAIPSEKATAELGPSFEKQPREVLTFEIPLNDTGSAGLGVSVKGRTQKINNEDEMNDHVVDLGIFIKSIINGGAASKDGRLKPNDQLISINGIPLLGLSNSDAMETLRRGMMSLSDGPNALKGPNAIEGHIVLTITRRMPFTPNNNSNVMTNGNMPQSVSMPSSPEKKGDKYTREEECSSVSPFLTSVPNSVANLKVRRGSEPTLSMTRILPESFLLKNFEAKRWSTAIAGDNNNISRNTAEEGYGSDGMEKSSSGQGSTAESSQESTDNNPTPSSTASNTFSRFMRDSGRQSMKEGRLEDIRDKCLSHKRDDLLHITSDEDQDESMGETTVLASNDSAQVLDVDLSDSEDAFTRDGFGRQSMSEKRHAHLDAKNTDTYQRNKKVKEQKKMQLKTTQSDDSSKRARKKQEFNAREEVSESDEVHQRQQVNHPKEQWSNSSHPSESRGRSTLFASSQTAGRSSLDSKHRQRSKSSGRRTPDRNSSKSAGETIAKDAEQFEQTSLNHSNNRKMTMKERNRSNGMISDDDVEDVREDDLVDPSMMNTPSKTPKTAIKTLFSPKVCCWNCKSSPGGCPYHSSVKQVVLNAETNPKLAMTMASAGRMMPHYQVMQIQQQHNSGLGKKEADLVMMNDDEERSSSMDNLDFMMQDLQRIQLDSSINTGHHQNHRQTPVNHQMMNASYSRVNNVSVRVARSRATNESFRAAVDRSYDHASGEEVIEVHGNNMETVAEEGDESQTPPQSHLMHHRQQLHQQEMNLLEDGRNQQMQQHRQERSSGRGHRTNVGCFAVNSRATSGGTLSMYSQSTAMTGTTTTTASTEATEDDDVDEKNLRHSGHHHHKSSSLTNKDGEKKNGILNKLFLKFGSRKCKTPPASSSSSKVYPEYNDAPTVAQIIQEMELDAEKIRAKREARFEQQRIQEHVRRLREQQNEMILMRHHQQQQQQTIHDHHLMDEKYGHYMNHEEIQQQLSVLNSHASRVINDANAVMMHPSVSASLNTVRPHPVIKRTLPPPLPSGRPPPPPVMQKPIVLRSTPTTRMLQGSLGTSTTTIIDARGVSSKPVPFYHNHDPHAYESRAALMQQSRLRQQMHHQSVCGNRLQQQQPPSSSNVSHQGSVGGTSLPFGQQVQPQNHYGVISSDARLVTSNQPHSASILYQRQMSSLNQRLPPHDSIGNFVRQQSYPLPHRQQPIYQASNVYVYSNPPQVSEQPLYENHYGQVYSHGQGMTAPVPQVIHTSHPSVLSSSQRQQHMLQLERQQQQSVYGSVNPYLHSNSGMIRNIVDGSSV